MVALHKPGAIQTFSRARMSIRFYWADNRRRDTLNAVQTCKPYIDGFVDESVFTDDSWQHLEVGYVASAIDREHPRVVFTIEEL